MIVKKEEIIIIKYKNKILFLRLHSEIIGLISCSNYIIVWCFNCLITLINIQYIIRYTIYIRRYEQVR